MDTTGKMCARPKRKRSSRLVLLAVCLAAGCFLAVQQYVVVDVDEMFESPFDDEDLQSLDLTLEMAMHVLDRYNITYFMASGTLLGSFRHHGRIPWDDDVDLIVNSSDKELVWKTLTALLPDYGLFLSGYIDSPYHWKFYPRRHGRQVPFKPFRWPFVDLLFFRENSTHVWNESPWFRDECWPRSAVFPLHLRPFGTFQIPAPCDSTAVLGRNFDVSVCVSRSWSHVYDVPMPWRSFAVPCSSLAHRHALVVHHSRRDVRQRVAGESLVLANRTLRTIFLSSACR